MVHYCLPISKHKFCSETFAATLKNMATKRSSKLWIAVGILLLLGITLWSLAINATYPKLSQAWEPTTGVITHLERVMIPEYKRPDRPADRLTIEFMANTQVITARTTSGPDIWKVGDTTLMLFNPKRPAEAHIMYSDREAALLLCEYADLDSLSLDFDGVQHLFDSLGNSNWNRAATSR